MRSRGEGAIRGNTVPSGGGATIAAVWGPTNFGQSRHFRTIKYDRFGCISIFENVCSWSLWRRGLNDNYIYEYHIVGYRVIFKKQLKFKIKNGFAHRELYHRLVVYASQFVCVSDMFQYNTVRDKQNLARKDYNINHV